MGRFLSVMEKRLASHTSKPTFSNRRMNIAETEKGDSCNHIAALGGSRAEIIYVWWGGGGGPRVFRMLSL